MSKAQRIAELLSENRANNEIAAIVTREFGTFTRKEYVRSCKQRIAGGGVSAGDRRYDRRKEKERRKAMGYVAHPRGKKRLQWLNENF